MDAIVPSDVFVSYKSDDVDSARMLARRLSERGWRVFWDRDGISGGDFINQRIYDELEKTLCVVTLWSATSVRSAWVMSEAQIAHTQGKLVPVRISDVTIPPPFTVIHTHDLSSWNGEPNAQPLVDLVERVAKFVERSPRESVPTDAPSATPQPGRLTLDRRIVVPHRPDHINAIDDDLWVFSETAGWFLRYVVSSGKIERRDTAMSAPVGVVAIGDETWMVCGEAGTLAVIDAGLDVVGSVSLAPGLGAPLLDSGWVWVPEAVGDRVFAVRPDGKEVHAVPVGRNPISFVPEARGVWVICVGDRTASLIDREELRVLHTYGLGRAPRVGLQVGDATWFIDGITGEISTIGPSLSVGTISVGRSVHAAASTSRFVWTTNQAEGSVTRIDRATLEVVTLSQGFGRPSPIVPLGGSVLVGDAQNGTVTAIDESGASTLHVKVGGQLVGLATIDDRRFATIDYKDAELVLLSVA